jgi:hypothetical protein
MTESERHVFTRTVTHEPKPDAQHQADLRAETLRQQTLDGLTIRLRGEKASTLPVALARPPGKKSGKKKSSHVELRDAKICSIPENLSLDEYAIRAARMQPPLTTRPSWQAQGGPVSMTEAVRSAQWRKQVADERTNAWNRRRRAGKRA